MTIRPVLLALSIMIALLGTAMVPCALIDIQQGGKNAHVFGVSAFVSITIGLSVWILTRATKDENGERNVQRVNQREAFLLTLLVWIVLPAIAAIPFIASGMSITDASFESISGLTTTGATVLTGLDDLPDGLLLWRAILQWIGGIGIIVTAIAILPHLRVGGMQLFQLESSDISGKFLPRLRDIATQLSLTYVILSAICAVAYVMSGMTGFDAIAHAMTTMAAGGYSTHDASFGFFAGTPAPYVATVFMIIAGLPFSLIGLAMFQGRIGPLLKDAQIKLFFGLIVLISLIIFIYGLQNSTHPSFETAGRAFSDTLFNVVSIITGTGYATSAYDSWGQPVVAIFLITMFLGGCAGSAACGIKMFRLEIAGKAIVAYTKRMTMPHRLVPVRFGGRRVEEDTLQSVMVFVFLYLVTFLITAALLGMTGLDPMTSISGAATSVSNVGPGLGPIIGPAGTFQTLPDISKWICAIAMLLGRLEFVAVFVVMTRRFWRG